MPKKTRCGQTVTLERRPAQRFLSARVELTHVRATVHKKIDKPRVIVQCCPVKERETVRCNVVGHVIHAMFGRFGLVEQRLYVSHVARFDSHEEPIRNRHILQRDSGINRTDLQLK